MADIDTGVTTGSEEPIDAEACFELGMAHSIECDMVAAHKWFNIAAMRGSKDAVRLRREIAEQMSDAEIGLAQKAARDWLKAHPPMVVVPAPLVEIRAAA